MVYIIVCAHMQKDWNSCQYNESVMKEIKPVTTEIIVVIWVIEL